MLPHLETACSVLENLQAEMLQVLAAMGPEGMNWQPALPETNSAYTIVVHATASQLWWIKENLHGEPIVRNRPAEFTAQADDLQALEAEIARVQHITREILAGLTPEDLKSTRQVRNRSVTVEWIVLHVIEHAATHLGHLQLTRQMWEESAAQHE